RGPNLERRCMLGSVDGQYMLCYNIASFDSVAVNRHAEPLGLRCWVLRESHTLRNVELLQGRRAGCRLTPCRLSRCYNVTLGLAEMPVRPRRGCVVVNW